MPDAHVGLLQDLLGALLVPEHAQRDREKMGAGEAIEVLERRAITQRHARHQLVEVGVRLHRPIPLPRPAMIGQARAHRG
jgi:hypothetical protein